MPVYKSSTQIHMVLKQVNNFRGSETKRKTNGSNIQINVQGKYLHQSGQNSLTQRKDYQKKKIYN